MSSARIDLSDFRAESSLFIRKLLPKAVEDAHRRIVVDFGTMVILSTPVDTGQTRANWQFTNEDTSADVVETTDKSGSGTVANLRRAAKAVRPFTVTHLINPLDHVSYLEDGSSDQAPAGMVGPALEAINQRYP